jgi:ribosome-binding factor A
VPPSHRPNRVGDQIRQELSDLLTRGAVHDPGIGFITLTRVAVTPDLQIARVYYTMLGDTREQRETDKALARATPFLRRQVGERLQLRRVPELKFHLDRSVAHQDRIEQILRDLHAEEASRGSAAGPATPDGGDTTHHAAHPDAHDAAPDAAHHDGPTPQGGTPDGGTGH